LHPKEVDDMEQMVLPEGFGMPPCRGRQVSALRRYIVACRSSACVAGRTGRSDLARQLVELADRVEQALEAEHRGALAALA
jgi:hypothetical protein